MEKGQVAYEAYWKSKPQESGAHEEFLIAPEAEQKYWAAAETASQEVLKGPFQELQAAVDLLKKQNEDLRGQLEVAQAAARGLQQVQQEKIVHPPIGNSVTFVNHAGHPEHAKVTGHGAVGVHLDIQGGHPNDKYKRQEVPKGGPGKPLTYY